MSLDRPNLTLDERSFEGLLSAAFVIQQHNDRRKRASQNEADVQPAATVACRHCGALKPSSDSRCPSCGQGEFRPGERLQRNWASMWSESQEQEHSHEQVQEQLLDPHDSVVTTEAETVSEATENNPGHDLSSDNMALEDELLSLPHVYEHVYEQVYEPEVEDTPRGRAPWNRDRGLEVNDAAIAQDSTSNISDTSSDIPSDIPSNLSSDISFEETPPSETALVHSPAAFEPEAEPSLDSKLDLDLTPRFDQYDTEANGFFAKLLHYFSEMRVKLRFQRADLYLGLSVFIAAIALLWPSAAPHRAASLSLWERALVTLGIAEAPAPVVHLQGDPSANVWIDPHTALYYCQGDEQFQKTTDGRLSSQREAQMDRFEPASRIPCE
jgi:ribosomal protein L40E